MNADEYRDRAAVWRQRAAERHDAGARAADLRLAQEYERLAESLSGSQGPAGLSPGPLEGDTEQATDVLL